MYINQSINQSHVQLPARQERGSEEKKGILCSPSGSHTSYDRRKGLSSQGSWHGFTHCDLLGGVVVVRVMLVGRVRVSCCWLGGANSNLLSRVVVVRVVFVSRMVLVRRMMPVSRFGMLCCLSWFGCTCN